MKKLLSFVLSLVMVISLLPLSASSDDSYFTIKDFYPVVDADKEVTLRVVVYQSADMRTHNRTHNGVVFNVIWWMIDADFGAVLLPVGTGWDVVGGVSSASNPLCSTPGNP